MRVATVFTGIAAATAGVTQVANAQDLTQARPGAAAYSKYGSIRSVFECQLGRKTPIDTTWVHLWWDNVQLQTSESECYGYRGSIYDPPGSGITWECGGENYGYLTGVNNGRSESYHFIPNGYHRLNWSHLYGVLIDSWAGTNKCGLP
jgi:hypothetical protein